LAKANQNTKNIRQFHKRKDVNIGIFLFAIILLYLLVTVFLYLTSKRISIYEVREGSILKDTSYTGLVIRDEEVIKAEGDGFVAYFISEGSKVKKGMPIYTLSAEPLISENPSVVQEIALSVSDQNEIMQNIQSYSDNFNTNDFSGVYALKNEIRNVLQSANNQTMTAQLDTILAENSNIDVYSASTDGIIIFRIDGYEDLTLDSLKSSNLVKAELNTNVLTDGEQLSAGDQVYKIITNEIWSLVVEIDEETAEQLQDTSSIKTRISKDSETLWADLVLMEKNKKTYACLTYDNSMIRYAMDRYLDVELIIEDESGLKIPKTAVVKKEFFEIPSDYLTMGGNSSSTGVLVSKGKKGNISASFVDPGNIYYSEDKETCYIDARFFDKGDEIVKPESMETFTLKKKMDLQGVYNINKGYAVFKYIEILCENDEYYIVETGTTNGLYNYDHIVLDGTTVKEDEIVFQ